MVASRRRAPLRAVAAAVLAVTLLGACRAGPADDAAPPPVVDLAAGSDVESVLLAETMAALLAEVGLEGRVEGFDDLAGARDALEFGVVDAMPGYTGAAWLEVLGRPDPPSDPRASFGQVRQRDLANDIEWLTPTFADEAGLDRSPADATFAIVVRAAPLVTVRPVAVDGEAGAASGTVPGGTAGATIPEGASVAPVEVDGTGQPLPPPGASASSPVVVPVVVDRVSQLASLLADAPDAALCLDGDFVRRQDGAAALFDAYAIDPGRPVVATPPAAAVEGVVAGTCVAGLATTTDGAAWAANLRPLVDDRGVFPAFVVAVQARAALRAERPEVVAAWAPLQTSLTTALLGRHNARVVAGEPVEVVAGDLAATLLARHAAG